MRYRVVFHPLADMLLVDLWVASQHREQVTRAVDWLEEQLAVRPADVGESREGDERIAFRAPVGIEFRIDAAAHEVVVFNVWEIKKRGGASGGNG